MQHRRGFFGSSFGWLLRLTLVALTLVVSTGRALAQDATPIANGALDSSVAWLVSQQAKGGGFLGFSGEPDAGTTTDAVLALVAAKEAGIDVDLDKALAFLGEGALVYAQTGPGQAAKLALTVLAAGGDPTNINNVNPLSIVEIATKSETGIIGFGYFDHALGVLALAATGSEIPDSTIEAFRNGQIEDGSWAFDGTSTAGAGDTNTTALAIQALVAAGLGDDEMVTKGLDYLKASQAENGAFGYQPGAAGDSNSTALAIQAIIAAGQDPASDDWKNAGAALTAFQNESGAFFYNDDMPDDNLFSTVQAIPALAGLPLPLVWADGVEEKAAA
jgi:hypothetical protein